MGASFLRVTEQFGTAEPLSLRVLEHDGEYGIMFNRNSAEVILRGNTNDDGTFLVVPIGFKTIDQANRAGRLLADAFAGVQKIHAEEIPETCDHHVRMLKFSRVLPSVPVCELCGADLSMVA